MLERLGEGGMGQVFKARHLLMKRLVAVKLIRKERLAQPEAVRRFHRELRAVAALQHPNIVMAFDGGQVGDVHFLAMEYVEGTDLNKLVNKSGPLPIAQACNYIRQAAVGLQHAHECSLVHRDIKPANLLLSLVKSASNAQGAEAVVKVMDMGLARLNQGVGEQTAAELTVEGTVMGTPDYIAPEQAQDSTRADIRADSYSLGCTLYFLLTGQPPFPGGSLAQKLLRHQQTQLAPVTSRRPDVPAGVVAVLARMLAKLPAERYQTPAEVARALEFGGALPPAAVPVTAAERQNSATMPTAAILVPASAGLGRSDHPLAIRVPEVTEPTKTGMSVTSKVEAAMFPPQHGPKRTRPRWLVPVLVGLVATNANAQMQDRCNINGPPWLTLVGGAVPRGIHHIEVPRTFGAPHPASSRGGGQTKSCHPQSDCSI